MPEAVLPTREVLVQPAVLLDAVVAAVLERVDVDEEERWWRR